MVSFGVQGKMEASQFLIATVVKEMRKAISHFFNPCSSKQLWKTGKILNKNNISTPALVRNGTTVSKDCDKASMLN